MKSLLEGYFWILDYYVFEELKIFEKLSRGAEKKEKLYKEYADKHDQDLPPSFNTGMLNFEGIPYSPPVEYNFPRGTIPYTMMILSCMEFLGMLYTGKSNNFNANIVAFFKEVESPPTEKQIQFLIDSYRNGIVHNFLPKFDYTIGYHSSNPPGKLFFKSIGNKLCLNVNLIVDYFKNGYMRIRLDTTKFVLMEANLKKIINNYNKQLSKYSEVDLLK